MNVLCICLKGEGEGMGGGGGLLTSGLKTACMSQDIPVDKAPGGSKLKHKSQWVMSYEKKTSLKWKPEGLSSGYLTGCVIYRHISAEFILVLAPRPPTWAHECHEARLGGNPQRERDAPRASRRHSHQRSAAFGGNAGRVTNLMRPEKMGEEPSWKNQRGQRAKLPLKNIMSPLISRGEAKNAPINFDYLIAFSLCSLLCVSYLYCLY